MDKKKILLFGGTFNPIHNGHLIVARHIAEMLKFNKVAMIPNGDPPHKKGVIDRMHRYKMLKQALLVGGNDDTLFDLCRHEMDKFEPSYTIDTVRYFKRMLGDAIDKPYWLIGPDNLYDIDNWHDPDALAEECSFVVGISTMTDPRCYAKTEETDRIMSKYDIQTVIIPHIDIRSTEIRNRIARGLPVRHYVPDAVEEYIRENGLYKTQ